MTGQRPPPPPPFHQLIQSPPATAAADVTFERVDVFACLASIQSTLVHSTSRRALILLFVFGTEFFLLSERLLITRLCVCVCPEHYNYTSQLASMSVCLSVCVFHPHNYNRTYRAAAAAAQSVTCDERSLSFSLHFPPSFLFLKKKGTSWKERKKRNAKLTSCSTYTHSWALWRRRRRRERGEKKKPINLRGWRLWKRERERTGPHTPTPLRAVFTSINQRGKWKRVR